MYVRRIGIGLLALCCVSSGLLVVSPASASSISQESLAIGRATADGPRPAIGQQTKTEALVVSDSNGTVRVPKDPRAAVTIAPNGREAMTLRLPEVKASTGVMDESGTVVYQGDSVSTAVQVLDKGAVRALVTLADQRAPSTYRFEFGAPAGLTLSAIEGGQGSIAVTGANGLPLGVVGAPWAKDARGAPLQTWYEIQGNAIVQHINTAGAAYPIVADPTHWWGYSIDMSSTTANQISAALAAGAGVSAIVAIFAAGSIAGIPGAVVYGVAAGILAIGAAGFQFLNAAGHGVTCEWTWVGFAGCYGR